MDETTRKPEAFLLLHANKSRNNVGNILRSAIAFGVKEVILYGPGKASTHGSKMSRKSMDLRQFLTLADAVEFLKKQPGGCTICGITVAENAQAVQTHPFRGTTCFLLGYNGQGLDSTQLQWCDHLVYVPQYSGDVPSLGSTVAGSIVLQHFGVWAGKQERERQGQKFVVTNVSGRDRYLNPSPEEKERMEERRAQRRERQALLAKEREAKEETCSAKAETDK